MRQRRDMQQHFSIRKLTVGAASVLIGISFLATANINEVHADTLNESAQTQQTENKQTDDSATAKAAQATPVQTAKTDGAVTEDAAGEPKEAAENVSKPTKNSDVNEKAVASSSNTETDNANTHSSDKQNDNSAQDLDKSTLPTTQSQNAEAESTKTTVLNTKTFTEDASALETKKINPQSLAESKIKESNPTDSLSASLQDGTTISISRDTVGATGDTSNVIIRVVYHNVKSGDKYTITIPKATVYGLVNADGQKFQVLGSTDIKDLAGKTQIVNYFNKESVTGILASQIF